MRKFGVIVVMGLFTACGIITGQTKTGSCDFRGGQDTTLRCETIKDSDPVGQTPTLAALKSLCSTGQGIYIDGECPRAGIVAGCQLGGNQSGAGEVTTNWYYDNPDAGSTLDRYLSPDDVKTKKCDKGDAPSTLVNP